MIMPILAITKKKKKKKKRYEQISESYMAV